MTESTSKTSATKAPKTEAKVTKAAPKETAKPAASKATPEPPVQPVLMIAQQDAPTENYPFSKVTAIKDHVEYLEHMLARGYRYSGAMNIAVGTEDIVFWVFYYIY